ncbi:alpha/beta hydrolase family protein [Chloroflexota bacterium]
MKSGRILKTPVWEMLFRVMAFMGIDLVQVKEGFTKMRLADINSTTMCRLTGHKNRARALQAEQAGDLDKARGAYFQAASFYLLSDFFLYRPEEEETNYLLAMPCYDKFRELSKPRIEKVEFPYQEGAIKAYFHLPEGDGPFPAIVFTQGNEGVKEAMTKWAEYATSKSIAVLNGEPPGWGESGLSGTHFRSKADMNAYAKLTMDFLKSRPEIIKDQIGIFGVSYGAFTSLFCAGVDRRFAAAGGIGAPYIDVNRVRKQALAAQRRKSHKISGAKTDHEHSQIMATLEIEKIMSQVQCPTLIIHGNEDLVLDGPKTNRQLSSAVSGEVTAKIIEGGDHLCSKYLQEWLADYIFDWYAEHLIQIGS